MSKAEAVTTLKKIDTVTHRIMTWAMVGMMSFCTFAIKELWSDWKAHTNSDRETELTVIRHDAEIKRNTTDIGELFTQLRMKNENSK